MFQPKSAKSRFTGGRHAPILLQGPESCPARCGRVAPAPTLAKRDGDEPDPEDLEFPVPAHDAQGLYIGLMGHIFR